MSDFTGCGSIICFPPQLHSEPVKISYGRSFLRLMDNPECSDICDDLQSVGKGVWAGADAKTCAIRAIVRYNELSGKFKSLKIDNDKLLGKISKK